MAQAQVERGWGQTKVKDSFFVEDVTRIEIKSEFDGPHPWARLLGYRIDMAIICCWWLLRGIEAASVKLNQAWAEIAGRTAFITLPCTLPGTKTEIVGRVGVCVCVTRSHP